MTLLNFSREIMTQELVLDFENQYKGQLIKYLIDFISVASVLELKEFFQYP